MPKRATEAPQSAPPQQNGSLDDLASFALSVVAARTGGNRINAALIRKLLDAVMGRSGESYRAVARQMLAMGVTAESIVDEYIPSVARKMGEEWSDDKSSFAEVTIGGTRLQSLLRELAGVWSADGAAGRADRNAAVIVALPQHAQHTLGASVLATRLRRYGLSVRLVMKVAPATFDRMLQNGTYAAVFISASLGDSMDEIRALSVTVKNRTRSDPLPVVLGGTIIEDDVDLLKRTGVDFATLDTDEAISFCGLAGD